MPPGQVSNRARWQKLMLPAPPFDVPAVDQLEHGEVMSVVTTAMSTTIVNNVGVMIPRCSPMLRMISSVSPRQRRRGSRRPGRWLNSMRIRNM